MCVRLILASAVMLYYEFTTNHTPNKKFPVLVIESTSNSAPLSALKLELAVIAKYLPTKF